MGWGDGTEPVVNRWVHGAIIPYSTFVSALKSYVMKF